MKAHQIFSNDGNIRAINADTGDGINELLLQGYASQGYVDAASEEEAISKYKDKPWTVKKERQVLSANSATVAVESALQNEVVIVDIKMNFWSMVVFMIKWAIAAIPAAIILIVMSVMFSGMFAAML